MKLSIKIGKKDREKGGIRRLYLALPTSLIKSRLAVKIIRSGLNSQLEEGKTPIISPDYITRDLLKTFYKTLKTVIKKHGHFNIIDVNSADGTKVLIRV